ncbi:uncharacterized protein [Argopecten irradians]|uniref:uncharacterized protein n=1 Tax=Argopecten irradians TaxID=31199 RepID=UPI00371E3C3E
MREHVLVCIVSRMSADFVMDPILLSSIKEYAEKQLTYKEISLLIRKTHNVDLSSNAIRKRLKRAGMPSRKGPTNHSENEVKIAIKELLSSLPHTVGYRQITDHLRQRHVHVRRDTVMKTMRELDPIGVDFRRRRRIVRRLYRTCGPNHVWHVDGYDKLKPYGLAIHGCIDGYSRKIMWLKVGPTNNDPRIVAHNYAQCVADIKGCPMILQSDPGTENVVIGALQCVLRHNSTDCFSGIHSYRIVRSVFNQRIEAWWSILRRQQSEWWISLFKDLATFGGFHRGNEYNMRCIRYCFIPTLQHELNCLADRWNSHFISRSRQAVCPNGRPIFLFSAPEETGFNDCLQRINEDDIDFMFTQCHESSRSGDRDFDRRARRIFQENGWTDATCWQDALQMYFAIVEMDI